MELIVDFYRKIEYNVSVVDDNLEEEMSRTVRNPVAKDLRTPKFRMRVVKLKTRAEIKHKNSILKELE